MAGIYDGLQVAPADTAKAPALTTPPPAAPRAPAGMYDGLELAPAQPTPTAPPQREAKGFLESAQAGLQASAPGLLWRGKLPELVLNPETASWWERAVSGIAQIGAELPIMVPAAIAGAPPGAAIGSAIAGPGPGTVAGSLLGAGFSMGAVPAGIRESLIQSYKSGETKTPDDWFNIVREVATAMLKEGGINAVSMGAGGLAGRAASKAIGPSIGSKLAVPVERVGSRSAQISTAGTIVETVDLTTQIATMVAMPAALQGRLPTAQEFLDAAILVGGLKTAHVTAQKMTDVYRKTGRTPAEQVADAQADPQVAADLLTPDRPPVDPMTGTASGVPVKLDKIIAEAEFLARGGVPEAPNIRAIIQEIKDAGPQQGDMIADIERIGALHDAARQKPLTDPERAELEELRARVADSDAIRQRIEAGEAPAAAAPRFEADQLTDAQARAKARVDELTAKTEALTDAERAERVMLTNAKPEALARHFGLEPVGPRRITAEAAAASAQRVHDDVLQQLRDADAARQEAGNAPLGDDHAQAVAALVRARVRTRAVRLGMLPEEIYTERALQIRAEGEARVAAGEIAPDAPIEVPPDAPTFMPPEVDLFGNPVEVQTTPRYAVENMATVEIPLAGLVLSKEVPQFKHAADAEGVVVPLGGKFDRTGVGPIQVWERLNGAMEVISGRHRLDLARRSGEETIPAQVHREADGFDARQAAILDAQLNIREEQGSVADYVQYFKDSGITREAADERGLLARAKGRTAFAIARDASPDLAAAHRAGVLSDEAALSISTTAPGSDRLQALGMAMVQEGQSILHAVNTMRAVDLMAAEKMAAGVQGDIFGFDDSAMREASRMAKRASSMQRKIAEQISAVSGASRRPELARKMGVDVADPQGIQKRIVELKQQQVLLDNWPMHPELVAKLRAPEVTGRENELLQAAQVEQRALEQFLEGSAVREVFYHGTDQSFDTFRSDNDQPFFFATSPNYASNMAGKVEGANIVPVYLRVLNLKRDIDIDVFEFSKTAENRALIEDFKAAGFDGLMDAYGEQIMVFRPEQIKSAIGNRGTFDPTDPNILRQEPAPNLPETPAEAAARDAEATAQAMRRLEREAAQARAESSQRPVLVRDEADGAPRLAHGPTALVEPREWAREGGTVMYEHTVLADGREVGMLSLGWTGDQVTQLHNIRTFAKDRSTGHGTAMLAAVLTHNAPETTVLLRHVIPSAREWWARRGAKFFETEEGEDGTITRADFEASPAVQAANRRNALAPGEAPAPRIGLAGGSEGPRAPQGARQPAVGQELFQDEAPGPIWYSALARVTAAAPMASAPAKGWRDFLKGQTAKGGVKADEIKWSGLDEWLDLREAEGGKITRDEVAAFLDQNGVKVTETKLGETDNQIRAERDGLNVELARLGYTQEIDPNDGSTIALDSSRDGKRYWLSTDAPAEAGELGYNDLPPDIQAKVARLAEIQLTMSDANFADDGQTKFSQYVLPGAKEGSYRELLLTLPGEKPKVSESIARYRQHIEAFTTKQLADEFYGARGETPEQVLGPNWTRQDMIDRMVADELDAATDGVGAIAEDTTGVKFRSSHFDTPNILAHVRFNERTDADGKRVLFIEEFQSDWAQKGKKEGFKKPQLSELPEGYRVTELGENGMEQRGTGRFAVLDAEGRHVSPDHAVFTSSARAIGDALRDINEVRILSGVPTAPFVGKTDAWVALSLKRMIRYAAEQGFDRVAWTTGEQQVSRYTSALRKQVDAIEWTKTPEGVQLVGYKGKGRPVGPAIDDGAGGVVRPTIRDQNAGRTKVVDTTEKETALSDAIGKAMAERIMNDPNQTGVIEGDGIKIDDTGMASFYDRIVPNVAKDVLKKLGGGKVGGVSFGDAKVRLGRQIEGGFESHADAQKFIDAEIDPDLPTVIARQADGSFTIHHRFDQNSTPEVGWRIEEVDGMFDIIAPDGMIAEVAHTRREAENTIQQFSRGVTVADAGVSEVMAAGVGKQAGFDITPAMRDKALEGLPLFQQHRGSFQVAENLITIMAGADKSTVVHELSHSWLEEMKADASRPDAPAQLRADWDTLRRELAIPESGEIPRTSHEQFARSGERYLAEGDAPTAELRGVFARFREWLLEIYRDLRNLNVEINPELRAVLDRMLATDEEIAAARELGVPRAYVEVAAAEQARQIVPGFKAEQVSMEPYADELPKGPGAAPDDSHVNYAYINTPLDVKLTMQRMAEIDQANIQKQRGGTDGVKSWAEANAEQARYVNDILGGGEDTLKLLQPRDPDAPGPDVRLGILKKLAVGAAKDSARLRDVVLEAGHDATVRQQLEYMGSIERARMIQAEFLGERASVARALNALKDVTEGSGEIAKMLDAIGYGEAAARELFQTARTAADEQAMLKAKLDEILLNYKGKSVLDIARLHKEIGTLKGTYTFTKAVTQASKWEMVVEGWKASLLSGPVTHTTNLFGTGAFMALRAPVDMLAAVIGTARGASPGMGESNRASMSEAVARLTGMLGGVAEGLRVAKATFDLDDPTGKTEAYRTAIPGRAGELIRVPLRLMGAEDALVSTMYKRGELATLAIRQAFDEGLNPATREFAERVAQLKDKPTAEMELAAEAAATRMTFNMPLGEKGVTLQLFVNKWNLQWMIPFIRTPINITKEVARMSPFAPLVGEWRADIAKGGVARDRAIAEITLGSGIMALTMAYAFAGQISGGGSADPGKNRGKAGVEQPYSLKIGDTWYEYARIQPTGTLMGMAADIATAWDHMTDEEKDKVPKLLARAFANAVTNQTFLQGITNVVNAMSEPARFAPKFLQQMAGSMVPNVIGQPTAMADPVVREVNGMLEAIQARIPGLRQDLLPKRDWLGEEVKTKERLGVVGPVRELKITQDKVRLEAARLDISMAAAPKKTHIGKGTGKLGDVELTPEERNLFQKVGGEMAHKVLTNIVNAPGYDDIPPLVKRKIFQKVLTASHQVAAAAALPMDKRIGYIQSISEKVAAELAPDQ